MNREALLEILLEHAKEVGDKRGEKVTAERFLVAIIDLSSKADVFGQKENIDALMAQIGRYTKNIDRLKDELLEYINSSNTRNFLDATYMEIKISSATGAAMNEKKDVLTAEMVLDQIMRFPSRSIALCIQRANSEQEKKLVPNIPKLELTEEETENLLARVDRRIKELEEEEALAAGGAGQHKESESEKEELTVEQVRLYSLQEATKQVKEIGEKISSVIFGQEKAVSVFETGMFRSQLLKLTDFDRKKPTTFLFAGPPGVGKTFFAETAADVLGLPFKRFDMSEYCDKEANIEFCGSDKVYRDSKPGNFTSFIKSNPSCVILFDEIEKAHINIIHLFLQMLDAGRIRDNHYDTEYDLKDVVMIFTTNAGRQLYSEAENGDFSMLPRKIIMKALEQDVNPETKEPFFPAAMCSRFASGNVVMFNHVEAEDLRRIVEKNLTKQAENLKMRTGIRTTFDENLFSAILYAEGGNVDARVASNRSATLMSDELFELFRLIDSEKAESKITDLEEIEYRVELPKDDDELATLFKNEVDTGVLVLSDSNVAKLCRAQKAACRINYAEDTESAKKLLKTKDIKLVLIDYTLGLGKEEYMNIEDADTPAREFFRYVREKYVELPVYMLDVQKRHLSKEEEKSFKSQGVKGFISLEKGSKSFKETLDSLCVRIYQQEKIKYLARSSKVITYETAQKISADGKKAEISLFDVKLITAVDAADSADIVGNVSKPDVKFSDVIGADDAKEELKFFVEYLKNPKKFIDTGVASPKGVLFYGPPGTGKTMLAKAMAGASNVSFIATEGNSFLNISPALGAQKVHQLFKKARKYAPTILFIDEIDAIAKERTGFGGTDEILTAFLTEMDGFKKDTSRPVFVLGATNFDVEAGSAKSLDAALMRRFDRRIFIDVPNRENRLKYLKKKLSENKAFEVSDGKLEEIAMRAAGMSLASLESVIELSLRMAIRSKGYKVTDEIFDEAFETYRSGDKKKWDAKELEQTAIHESGHAFLCWHKGETPSYLTIVARGNHGGYMQHADNEGKGSYTKNELLSLIRVSLGGRAAEIVFYGLEKGITTGASSDLYMATKNAQQIVCLLGMDEDFGIGVVNMDNATLGELSSEVRVAVNKILKEEMANAIRLIEENKKAVKALADALLDKNNLSGEDIDKILKKATKK